MGTARLVRKRGEGREEERWEGGRKGRELEGGWKKRQRGRKGMRGEESEGGGRRERGREKGEAQRKGDYSTSKLTILK